MRSLATREPPWEPVHRIVPRWRDTDGLGHVNNAVFFTYFEEGRGAWLRQRGLGETNYAVVRSVVDFKREIRLETVVLTRCRALELGTKSVTTHEQLIDADGELIADGTFVIVIWDRQLNRSRELTEAERASLTEATADAQAPTPLNG